MADTTFINGTVIENAWLNDVNDFVYGNTAQSADKVNYLQTGTGAASRTVQNRLRERISVKDFGAVGDGVTNDQTAFTNAVTQALVDNKDLFIPAGEYLLNGVAGSDTYKNGILLPFTQVNFDPLDTFRIYGEAGTILQCGADDMVLVRVSRNSVILENFVVDYNGHTNVILVGIVPESMTQTTTLVSQSHINLININRVGGAGVEGIVIQPGPTVGGADSGCFYHNIYGGSSNFVGGGRHVYLKKNADWGSNPNRPTRTNFFGQRLVRGNAGFYFEVGSEINLFGCNEEFINTNGTPLATATARYVSSDCTNINFFAGYSESCSKSFAGSASNVNSFGYQPASGSDLDFRTYAASWGDSSDSNTTWTPVLESSGGGAQGAATSTGKLTKQGKIVFFTAQISAAIGTLLAGTLSVSGLPFIADSSWAGADFQGVSVTKWSGITFSPNVTQLAATVSGATIAIRKLHAAGASVAGLTLAECGAGPVVFTVQGWYKTA